MTQPTSVDMTFDTSLVDLSDQTSQRPPSNLNVSFSTTESDSTIADPPFPPPNSTTTSTATAGSATPAPNASKTPTLLQDPIFSDETPKKRQKIDEFQASATAIPPKPSTPVQYQDTQKTYDEWADVYDTDGNMLQSIDDLELSTFLPKFLALVTPLAIPHGPTSPPDPQLRFIDLGCGTGRNTAKLVERDWTAYAPVKITGLDFSAKMLDVAREKLGKVDGKSRGGEVDLQFHCVDCFPTVSDPTASPLPAVPGFELANGVISTLVLEHISLPAYFDTLASLVTQNGYALVTNMHSEMGKLSQAGFVNKQGVKVRGTSFVHTVEETVQEAKKYGFEAMEVRERKVERASVEGGLVGKRGEKWVGVKVWYGVLFRKVS